MAKASTNPPPRPGRLPLPKSGGTRASTNPPPRRSRPTPRSRGDRMQILAAYLRRRKTSKKPGLKLSADKQLSAIELAALTAAKRAKLSKSSFAVPKGKGSKPGADSYPVNDLAHAKNALARVAANGTPEEKRLVIAAVKRKFPALAVRSKSVKGKAA